MQHAKLGLNFLMKLDFTQLNSA